MPKAKMLAAPRIARSFERARIETQYTAAILPRTCVSPAHLSGRGLKQRVPPPPNSQVAAYRPLI